MAVLGTKCLQIRWAYEIRDRKFSDNHIIDELDTEAIKVLNPMKMLHFGVWNSIELYFRGMHGYGKNTYSCRAFVRFRDNGRDKTKIS